MRKTLTATLAATLVLGSAFAATADIVENGLDVVDGDKETVELLVGETGSVEISIEVESTSDGDGPGCNIAGSQRQLVLDVTSDDAGAEVLTPQITFVDCDDVRTVEVEGVAATGEAGANITFAVNEEGTQLRDGDRRTVIEADFVVNVIAPEELEGRDAPAIANAYLHASEDNSDCQEAQGTNRNKNNWHGQLIKQIAQQFEGRTFTSANESTVTDAVDGLCGR